MTDAPHSADTTPPLPDNGPALAGSGVQGLDALLGGGFPRNHAYLIQGRHGSGKTTLALRFLLEGVRRGERCLYLTTCETEGEIREVADSHGWSLEGMEVHFHDPRDSLQGEGEQSVFHPAEVELPRAMEAILDRIESANPRRLVIDSLSELRLLSPEGRRFRRQILALKQILARRRCTTLLCDDHPTAEQPVHSIVHGVVHLEQTVQPYGPDRRHVRVVKLRGRPHATGRHDFRIVTGGLQVFPRLVAAGEHRSFAAETVSSGVPELDDLFGGGIDRGTAPLFFGPSGTGKSTLAIQYAVAAADRGERAGMYVFDERLQTLRRRAAGLGMDLEGAEEEGLVELRQVGPAELSPGEFSHILRTTVDERGLDLVVIDSLAGYVHAMSDERFLTVHLHELVSYLSQQGVTTILVMSQHGLPGTPRHVPFDLSYVADSVLLFHSFEALGELRRAISAYKRRGGAHEPTLRELRFGPRGIWIGEPLREFRGITTGSPDYMREDVPHVGERHRD